MLDAPNQRHVIRGSIRESPGVRLPYGASGPSVALKRRISWNYRIVTAGSESSGGETKQEEGRHVLKRSVFDACFTAFEFKREDFYVRGSDRALKWR